MAKVEVDTNRIGDAIKAAATPEEESEQRVEVVVGADQTPATESGLAEVPLVRVKVQRDLEHIVTDVFQHEVDILRAVHGEDNIEVIAEEEVGYGELPDSATAEFERLRNKYDRKNFKVIAQLFPRGVADVAQASGLSNKTSGKKASQADITIRKPARKR